MFNRSLAILLFAGLSGAVGTAWAATTEAETQAEIDYILTTVGRSECVFIRNGTEHSAVDAESHLRLKYKRGARYVDTSEDFIDRLASSSSWTNKPYQVRCSDGREMTASAWLHSMLRDYRQAELAASPSH
jgi:hypothetical protein